MLVSFFLSPIKFSNLLMIILKSHLFILDIKHRGLMYKLQQNGISGDILNIIIDFLSLKKQWVILNGQVSHWSSIEAGVPEGSILRPLLFLIYINDLPDDLSTNDQLFVDHTALFSVAPDINTSVTHLNNNLRKIRNWLFQWKMSFNLDPRTQAQEIIFSYQLWKISHPSLYFSNNPMKQVSSQKHLGMILDTKLNFKDIKNIQTKVNKIKLLNYYERCKTSCPEDHYLQYLNRFPGLILIMVMLYMTRIIILCIRRWNQYNIT